jgi:superfamily II DNA helicase RecQ
MPVPSVSTIRADTLRILGVRPCLWQIRVVEAFLKGDKDVVTISATGSGKTLTFLMPLLFHAGFEIIICPLKTLGSQLATNFSKAGISAVNLHSETATLVNYMVCW